MTMLGPLGPYMAKTEMRIANGAAGDKGGMLDLAKPKPYKPLRPV